MNWRVKPLVQMLISLLPEPYSERVNQFLSRRFGGLRAPAGERWGRTLQMIDTVRRYGRGMVGLEVLEIGTGWSCLSALTVAQFGTKRVETIDLYRHVRADRVKAAVEHILRNAGQMEVEGALRGLDAEAPVEEILARAGVVYSAPRDVTAMAEECKYDLIYSQTVLEHVPEKGLRRIVEATARLLKPGGLAYHRVTPADHFSWSVGGRGLSPYNFLKYSSRHFNLFYNPRISYQNRWRCSQYLDLFAEAGFRILDVEREIRTDRMHEIDAMRIAPEFRRFDRDDLATEQFSVLLVKPTKGSGASG